MDTEASRYRFMSLFETICYRDGALQNLEWHEARMRKSYASMYPDDAAVRMPYFCDLHTFFQEYTVPVDMETFTDYLQPEPIWKIKLKYSDQMSSLDWDPYKKRRITKLRVVENDEIEYSHKYGFRTILEHITYGFEKNEEAIIVKNGLVRDTTYTNLVFAESAKSTHLYTPAEPLLEGTQRAALLHAGEIIPEEIKIKDLQRFKYAYLINSMMRLGESRVQLK